MTRIVRRFNYTKRTKIARKQVHIDTQVAANGSCVAVVQHLDLSERGQHSEAAWKAAEVFLEARRTTSESWARQPLGTVAELESGGLPKKVVLEGFGDDIGITFRIKVVDQESRLLADGDDLQAGTPQDGDREPLIHLIPADLGEEIWRIDQDDANGPRILINKRLPNYSGLLTRDALVRGIVMPQIVREVLPLVAAAEQQTEPWVQKWSDFAKRLSGEEVPEDPDDVDEWVDEVVRQFTLESKFATLAEDHLQKLGDE